MDNVETPAPSMWRPLGFGQILDRSITQYFKNFLPFVSIALVLAVPYGVIQYFVDSFEPKSSSFIAQLEAAGSTTATPTAFPPWLAKLMSTPGGIIEVAAVFLVFALIFTVLQGVVSGAAAVGVARIYTGERVDFRACYETVLRRWGALLGLLGMAVLIYLGFVTAIGIIVAICIFMAYAGAGPLIVLIAIPLVPAIILATISGVVALTFAMYAIVIENVGVFPALSSGFTRAFSKQDYWRIVGMVLVSSLIGGIGGSMISILASIALFYGQAAIAAAITAIAQVLVLPFSVMVMAVLYYDVRIRREGLDLEASVERLVTGDIAPA